MPGSAGRRWSRAALDIDALNHQFFSMNRLPGTILAAGCLAGFACGDDTGSGAGGGTPARCTPDLASIQATVFVPSCTGSGCHSGVDPASMLDLTQGDLEARLVDRSAATCDRILVVPGNSQDSFLNEKISSDAPECGARMPLGGQLDGSQIACISDWIDGLPAGCETCGGGACVDLESDGSHCGDCATVCATDAVCTDGSCVCSVGTLCGSACVNIETDPDHCGDCDGMCPPVQVCNMGGCSSSCDASLTQCDQSCVDITSDPQHCGDCTTSCGTGGTCESSVCACPGGADPLTDPSNCGSCGNTCAPGQGCEDGACVCGAGSVSFASDVQPIFTASCATAGCHKGAMPQEGLNLSTGKAYDAIVNVDAEQCTSRKRVLPGQPSESYLMDKLLGVDLCFGTKMPKMGSVDSADVETIAIWICAGAPDN